MNPLVLFAGASGTGKTTLAKWASEEFGLPLVASGASQVYKDFGVKPEDCVHDPKLWHRVQMAILDRLTTGMSEAAKGGAGFVSDRCFDVAVYTPLLLETGAEIYDKTVESLDPILGDPRALIFLVRPHPDVLANAKASDGGRRSMFMDDAFVHKVDGACELYLESHDYPYVTVDSPRMKDRCRLVRRVVELWKGKE